MAKNKLLKGIGLLALIVVVVWTSNANIVPYLILSLAIILFGLLPFVGQDETGKYSAREIVVLAITSTLAGMSRVPFAALPSVQPSTFMIMMAGYIFGSDVGFLTGAATALISNIFLGQGPWTPWQMLCWGGIGLITGLLRQTILTKLPYQMAILGFLFGFLFGWIMNIWTLITLRVPFEWASIWTFYVSSFYFDLAHALSNVFFIFLFGKRWGRYMNRLKVKYGLFEHIPSVKIK